MIEEIKHNTLSRFSRLCWKGRQLVILCLAAVFALSAASCADYLDVVPENSQVADDYWQTGQDVERVLMGGYYYLRSTVEPYLIPWGEVRAGIVTNNKSNTKLQTWQIQASNTSLCDWSTFYKIINIANTVLARADEACRADDTYSEAERNSHYSEAYFLRALSYFYLVRNFREVPLTTVAYENDNVVINVPKTSEDSIVSQIKADVLAALQTGAAKETFSTTWETKGRATRWALYALMADVCLWSGDYEECIRYADALLTANSPYAPRFLSSPTRASFMSMFNPGNSNESIFEIQWNYEEQQTNNLPHFFDDFYENASTSYVVCSGACEDFAREYVAIVGDVDDESMSTSESARTLCASIIGKGSMSGVTYSPGAIPSGESALGFVWKYIGSTSRDKKRTSVSYDPNFIIYRVADLILMKAEALLLIDGGEPSETHRAEALDLLNQLRRRAGYDEDTLAEMYEREYEMSQEELLGRVLDERKLEILGEGKIWYDMLRMGRRDDNRYKQSLLIDQVVSYNNRASASWLRSVLNSDNALFLPIMSTEIERNPLLVQNPYYK
ncbi:MAG: RagB/SusD family nutrient uptake outer membrane protein [Bacteroidaceae bacterium]|nr:RagB/SusD family nutrient uptake outer membrane protein [Bacteroidaceae bacterium]